MLSRNPLTESIPVPPDEDDDGMCNTNKEVKMVEVSSKIGIISSSHGKMSFHDSAHGYDKVSSHGNDDKLTDQHHVWNDTSRRDCVDQQLDVLNKVNVEVTHELQLSSDI